MVKKKLVTLQDFIDEAKRLRAAADASEKEFLDFLCHFETREDLWRPAYPTFDKMLEAKNADICKPSRYRLWALARKEVPEERIEKVGVNYTVAGMRIHNEKKRELYFQEAEITVQERGCPGSQQGAAAMASRYEPHESSALKRASRVQQLETECARLTSELKKKDAEIKRKDKRIAELEAKITRLEAKLAKRSGKSTGASGHAMA